MNAFASFEPEPRDVRAIATATLVAAFEADAAARAFYPDDADYARHFPGFVDALGGAAFDAGIVDRDPHDHGAALWVPPGVEPDGAAFEAFLEATIPAGRLAPLAAGFELQAGLHPLAPHWYLPWIGVRPGAQGLGLGSRLMRRGLARADAEGMPAYVEATNRRNAVLYARHGFEVIGVVETEGYPEIIAMWRNGRHEPYSG